MNLVTLNPASLVLGQPLPFSLRGTDGLLLASKGHILRKQDELDLLVERGVQLCVDTDESGESFRAYRAQLQQMLISDTSLGEIAAMKIDSAAPAATARVREGPVDWPGIQWSTSQLLGSPNAADFAPRFLALQREVTRASLQTPDATLLTLIQRSSDETRIYSATHVLLVACVSMLVARDGLHWNMAQVERTGRVALTMNISMTDLQDRLAQQSAPLTGAQIALIQDHSERSATLLASLGVSDQIWLDAVRQHHDRAPGPLAGRSEAAQIARLVQRTDIFAARMAPRAGRTPMVVTAAIKACYYDETQKVDEAGAAMLNTLGIYPPGALVNLASQEVAVVIKRGTTPTTPRVAVVRSRTGMPTGEFIPRDTSVPAWRITGAVAQHELRMQLP
ncbi:MAG: HD-GYP domain-containing protein, partial [Giesbergeria sp.]